MTYIEIKKKLAPLFIKVMKDYNLEKLVGNIDVKNSEIIFYLLDEPTLLDTLIKNPVILQDIGSTVSNMPYITSSYMKYKNGKPYSFHGKLNLN